MVFLFHFVVFICLSAYIFYKILGDFPNLIYRNYAYHIIKLLGAFIRGSIDSDVYLKEDMRKQIPDIVIPNSQNLNSLINYASTPYFSLSQFADYDVYLLVYSNLYILGYYCFLCCKSCDQRSYYRFFLKSV